MIVRTENIELQDGAMDVFIARPDGPGPFPVVAQVMDALGMRDELRGHAQRVASWGYYVMAPDLFYRRRLKGPIDITKPDNMNAIMAAMKDLTATRATSDVKAALELASNDKSAQNGKIGLYGFCMGGKLTLSLCQSMGDRVAVGAAIHPGGLVSSEADSPHRHLDNVQAELYFGIADKDQSATSEQMVELEAELKAHNIVYQLEQHPGALHGFMMPSRAEIYNEKAAEKIWRHLEKQFARKLK